VTPFGNTINPKLIIVLSHPDKNEWEYQKYFASPDRSIFRQSLGNQIGDVYVTSIVKTVEHRDTIHPEHGIRKPSLMDLISATPQLKQELSQYPNATIMPIGSDVCKTLLGPKTKIDTVAGKETKWENFRVVPNSVHQTSTTRSDQENETTVQGSQFRERNLPD
jgi:uracil-DNA glycosylase